MKKVFIFTILMCAAVTLFAQEYPEHQFASGSWELTSTRLYQNDATAGLAKLNIMAPQSGPMIYEFNAQYEDGLEDGQGGFGLHVFADSAYNGPSWGVGNSYLLWLNYDEHPTASAHVPTGFSAQVYRSRSNSAMDLMQSYDLNEYLPYITRTSITKPVPVKIWINGNTGEVRVYDPSDPLLKDYFLFYLDRNDTPLSGNWISLRTNGVSLSFGLDL